MIGFTGFQRVAKQVDEFAGNCFRPQDAQGIGKIMSDQRAHIFKHFLRSGTDQGNAEIRIDTVNAKWGIVDQLLKGVVGGAVRAFDALANGYIANDRQTGRFSDP